MNSVMAAAYRGLPLVRILLLGLIASALPAQTFVDETSTRFPTPPPGDYSNQLTIGDLDGDDDLDIVFANGGGFISQGTPEPQRVYINNGSGTFTDESLVRLGFSGLCRGVELGDIDNDGDLDMLFAQDFNRQPALFENNGAGFFSDVTGAQLPSMTLASSRAQFGDIDNDGDLDIYIASGTDDRFDCGQNRIYVNDGTGTFSDETALRHPTESLCENMDVTFGDVNGDLAIDVRVGNRDGSSRLYVNDGAGVFTTSNTVPADSSTYSYDFGDVDGDGDLDMLGANSRSGSSGEALFINNGSGVFSDASSQISPNPNDDDNDSKFLDYDNDGDLDLIIARLGGSAEKIYNNDGDGNFTQVAGLITTIGDSSLDLMVADLTGDGRLDIVTAQGESGVFTNRIYVNNGGAQDTLVPRIIDTETLAATSDTVGPYPVRAAILDDMSSDRNFFHESIELHYTVGGGAVQMVDMDYVGGQIYRGEIPGQAGGSVRYFVVATDLAGNTATGPSQSFDIGALFSNGFESGDTSAWTTTVRSSATAIPSVLAPRPQA